MPTSASRPRLRGQRHAAALAGLVVVVAFGAGCSGGGTTRPSAAASTPPVAVTLPPGELSRTVLQPDEVGTGFVALPAQTGPADVARIAGFSANAPAAQASLRRHHFEAGYVVEYLDSASGRFIVNVVTRFADDRGATADLTADLARQGSGAEHVDVASLGDQSGATRQPYKDGGPTGQLLTLRFRVGATTMLLSLGGRKPVDVADAQGIATHLVDRLRAASGATAPTDSPAPGATSS